MNFHVLRLHRVPIFEQLLLEEALLRTDPRNWCLINVGSPPSIVMGISGKKEELVDCAQATSLGIPLIKRFSGGGTVLVDEETLFVTFICQKELHPFPSFPEPILRWAEDLYKQTFSHPQFRLRENDFAIGDKKCAGNAQYIKKDRWLHHTSFLWDYSQERMQLLLMPKKTPKYREGRAHADFLCRLKDFFPSKEHFIDGLLQALAERYALEHHTREEVLSSLTSDARIATALVT